MCFNNKYKYRTFHGGCYQITKNKQAENKNDKHFLKDCMEQFFNFSY